MNLLFVDLSTKLKTVDDLQSRARGGMVSSLFTVTNLLSEIGHNVTVASDIEQQGCTSWGVHWPHRSTDLTSKEWDVLVCNRGVVDGYPEIQAKRRILWTHDLPHNGFIPNPKTINAFHAVVFMSDFARKIWSDFYPPIRNIRSRHFKIPNGVDREIFRPGIKDLNYIIYASAPNRGLKRLPLLLDAIRSKLSSKIHLKAFSNLQVLHPNEVGDNPDEFQGIYKTVEESSVELHDPLPQRQFAIELGRAGLMLLPTDYPEICSNAVIQSLACGTPVISTGGIGSIGEWVTDGYNGRLTGYRPTDYMVYQVELVRAMVDMMSSDTEHRKYVARTSRTNLKSWDQVASLWDQMIRKIS